MLREEYLRRLIDAAHIEIYLAANDGARIYWPWRIQPVHEAKKPYRNACERYMIDSSFQFDHIENGDVLDKAHELDAEVAILQDVYQDFHRTVVTIREGLEAVEDHPFEGQIMVPLQAPHAEMWEWIEDDRIDMVAIGGLKDGTDRERIAAAKEVRRAVGEEVHVHGLGWGLSDVLVSAIHEDPGLLDSVDYSTPVQRAMDDHIDDGDEHLSVVAARAGGKLIEDLRRVTPYVEVDEEPPQLGLDEWTPS